MRPTHRPESVKGQLRNHKGAAARGVIPRPALAPVFELARTARVWLAGVLDARLLLTLAAMALVACILTISAHMQQKPKTGNKGSIVQTVPAAAMAETR